MKRAEVGQVVEFEGKLQRVIAIGEGRTVVLLPVGAEACTVCGKEPRTGLLEHSPLFQDEVAAVKTLEEK